MLYEDVNRFAKEIGIPVIGMCRIGIGKEKDRIREWIDKGFAADMDYMKRTIDIRCLDNPIIENQKSVIICLFSYPARLKSKHISSYALFPDYHDYVKNKLGKLEDFIKSIVQGIHTKTFSDTLLIMEKPLAVKAGLGFQGKNTLLISPEFGSYCFIGGIIIDVELPGCDNVQICGSECGSCRACIDICPTKALSEQGLDARLCISYHTIENRGQIPHEIKDKMGECVFGCGLCETVCPKNNGIKAWSYPDWLGDEELAQESLLDLHTRCAKGFKKNFKGTPILRIGKKVFLRNLLIAMGNSKIKEYILIIENYLSDEYLSSYAEEALRKLS